MTRVAAQSLVDAGAALEPAERSLLNLMINHGLDDEAVGRLTHMSSGAIASRREQLIAGLSGALGLPPATIRDAVEELAVAARANPERDRSAAEDNHAPADVASGELAPADARSSASGPAAPVSVAPDLSRDASSPSRRRRLGAWALAAAALVIGVALVVILASGPARHRATAARKLATTAPAAQPAPPPAQPAPAAQPAPPAAVRRHREQRVLAGLPGGPAGVTGSLTIVGPPSRSRLDLTVSGLPSPGRSHYELWLYNSIIDAVPLARVRAPGAHLGVSLAPGFHRYRWLDISLQRPGSVNHSGESIVRAAVPR